MGEIGCDDMDGIYHGDVIGGPTPSLSDAGFFLVSQQVGHDGISK
jgi:hypothetical protein